MTLRTKDRYVIERQARGNAISGRETLSMDGRNRNGRGEI